MKNYLITGLFILLASAGFSQSNSLGINAGFGHSWIKNYDDIQFNPHGNFGLAFVHSTKSNFGFGADLKFSLEGGQEEYKTTGVTLQHTTDLNYIRMPLKVIYFFGNYGQKIRPKIHVGPTLGLLVGATDKVINMNNNQIISDLKTDDEYNNFDIGINAGIGFNYRLVKNTWFTTDLNYYNSFRDLRQADAPTGKRYSNANVALNIGVNWGIGK